MLTTFTSESGMTMNLNGTLLRVVSGLSVTVSGIPGYIESVTLVAERMVKAIRSDINGILEGIC